MNELALPPLIAPGETAASMTDAIASVSLRPRTPLWWTITLVCFLALLGLGVIGLGWTLARGIRVWGNNWPTMWGFPIFNYVWWIGIASGGTFISALFYLLRVEWRTSLNRLAETMTLFAAACAGIYPIVHLGRPWFFYWLFPYPNTMGLWPQFRSPLFWDFIALLAYVVCSVLFWFLGLIPDFATMRDRASTRMAQVSYGILAMGFRGSGQQWRHYRSVYGTLAALMAPLVVSVHSVVGLDFAGAAAPGWHSTEFPPFFVFGAIYSGFAVVTLLVLPLRPLLDLYRYITDRHLDILGKLMLTSGLCVAYAYVMDAFSTFYGAQTAERNWFMARLFGPWGWVYWATLLCNVVIPQILWFPRFRRHHLVLVAAAVSVVCGMWFERFDIVVTTLQRADIPSAWGVYRPTFWDWSIFAGTIGLFGSGMLVAIRIIPVVSMFEMRELMRRQL